ncbi:MAG TPA: cytochrome c [Chloroflexia bacterium]|nr:cytochrome c [Chloroflexia bacterium]
MAIEEKPETATGRRGLPRGFWPGFITGIFALVIIGGILGFLLSPELLKHRSPFPLEEAIGASRVSAAIPSDYKNKTNPLENNPQNLAQGKQIYTGNCAFCHGLTGKGDGVIGRDMYPQAANLLASKTVEKTDGELDWILEKGLSFVGMPSFGSRLSEDDLWKAILYVRALESGTAASITVAAPTLAPANPTAAASVQAATTTQASGYGQATAASTPVPSSTTASATTAAAPANGQSSDAARGLEIFKSQGCANCHGGEKATGGLGPSLVGITFPESGLLRQVRSGSGAMPAFSPAELPDSDVALIYAFLKTLK